MTMDDTMLERILEFCDSFALLARSLVSGVPAGETGGEAPLFPAARPPGGEPRDGAAV